MHRPNTLLLLALLATAALTLSACDSASEKLAEEAAEAAGGGDVNIDIDEENSEASFSFEGESEGEGGSFTTGGSIPDDFPEDVPLPDEYQVQASTEIRDADGEGLSVILNVPQDAEELADFYAEHFDNAGWEVQRSAMGGEMFNITAEIGTDPDRRVVTAGVFAEDGGAASVNLTVLQPSGSSG